MQYSSLINILRFFEALMQKQALCQEKLDEFKENDKVNIPKRKPTSSGIAHFGVGAFHRSHQALYTQLAMDSDEDQTSWGIVGVGIMPFDLKMNQVLKKQDYLYTLVEKAPEGTPEYRIINSIIDHIYAAEDTKELLEKVSDEKMKIITLTITEGGYYIKKQTGELDIMHPSIQHDKNHWRQSHPKSIFGYLAKILDKRKQSHGKGITILSCDNIQHNGRVIEKTLLSFLAAINDPELLMWVKENCTFPNSMVDRITPQTPPELLGQIQNELGYQDQWPVSSEDFKQWVIEDKFVCGRPDWEKVGAQFVPDVSPYEKMKLRILNGSHQALCYIGSLAGMTYVHEAAQNEIIQKFLKKYMAEQVRETLDPVPGINLEEYEDTIIRRFSNANVKDTLSRICEFTSDRIPIFNVPSMQDSRKMKKDIPCSALIIASWIVYAQGKDENGKQLPLVDNRKQQVLQACEKVKQNNNINQFMSLKNSFGGLAGDQQFCSRVQKYYNEIMEKGSINVIKQIIE